MRAFDFVYVELLLLKIAWPLTTVLDIGHLTWTWNVWSKAYPQQEQSDERQFARHCPIRVLIVPTKFWLTRCNLVYRASFTETDIPTNALLSSVCYPHPVMQFACSVAARRQRTAPHTYAAEINYGFARCRQENELWSNEIILPSSGLLLC